MLTQDQLDQFDREGYLVVENLIDATTIASVKQEYFALMDSLYDGWFKKGLVKAPPEGMSFWEKLEQCYKGDFDWFQPFDICLPHDGIATDTPMHFGPAVFEMATHDRILNVVEQLIGPEITSNPIQHVRIKPPEHVLPKSETRAHVTSTDWHQDMGVTLEEADNTNMVTVWLAITDAQIEHGCLQVAPGRRSELLPHCLKTQVGIADQFLPKEAATPTPVKAGGAVIFNPYTPHASLSNTSDVFRWSFDLRYNVTGHPTGRSQFPDFVARSKANPESELKDWQEWKEMWQSARALLSSVPPISQHRWDNNSPHCA
jgi:ectoine hydroxylase-related dioxygenase (phytanoyl-CoA dioxygenase family)